MGQLIQECAGSEINIVTLLLTAGWVVEEKKFCTQCFTSSIFLVGTTQSSYAESATTYDDDVRWIWGNTFVQTILCLLVWKRNQFPSFLFS